MWRHFSFSVIFIFCAVIGIDSWSLDNFEYARNKRAKYYFNPSHKYYRPLYSHSYRGPNYSSSYGYTSNDIGPSTSKLRPYKVSKRPINEGLGDEDLGNIIKYLSSKDLDKIVELAAEKQKNADKYNNLDEFDDEVSGNDFWNVDYEKDSPNIYPNPNIHFDYNKYSNVEYPQAYMNSMFSEIPVQEETEKLSQLDEYIQREINVMSDRNNIFTDSSTIKEEELPKPSNLREGDYYGSFTNNVATVVQPEFSYRLENFANLPLMGYENSKLEKVNSYSVPHYSVISSSNHRPRSPSPPSQLSSPSSSLSTSILSLINAPEVEPAPPASTAKEQSDAHLKAIKIWTHKSKGTAYTLHDDGTLSLENPSRPRYKLPN